MILSLKSFHPFALLYAETAVVGTLILLIYFVPERSSSFIKAPSPNLAGVSPLQMTVANSLHPSKHFSPMDLTLLPIVASVKDVHSPNILLVDYQYYTL